MWKLFSFAWVGLENDDRSSCKKNKLEDNLTEKEEEMHSTVLRQRYEWSNRSEEFQEPLQVECHKEWIPLLQFPKGSQPCQLKYEFTSSDNDFGFVISRIVSGYNSFGLSCKVWQFVPPA